MDKEPIIGLEDLQEENNSDQSEQKSLSSEDLSCGFIVGVRDNGDLVFEVLGKQAGLVQLLGLLSFAQYKVELIRDMSQSTGFPVLAAQQHQALEHVKIILKMMTEDKKQLLRTR